MMDPHTRTLPSILLVEDDEALRLVLARSFRSRGYDIRVAGNYDDAVASVQKSAPRSALIDLRLPGRSGLELVEAITRHHPEIVVVVLTADRSSESVAEATRRGAKGYVTKPADTDEIIAALTAAHAR
jgi:two-component system, response regulator RegA